MEDEKNTNNYWLFEKYKEIFSSKEKIYVFLIGALVNYLLYIQRSEKGYNYGEEPFRKDISLINLDSKKLKIVYYKTVDKLNQYKKDVPLWFKNFLKDNIVDNITLSKEEIAYYFALGLALGNLIKQDENGGEKNDK